MPHKSVYKVPTFGHKSVHMSIKLLIMDTIVFTVTRMVTYSTNWMGPISLSWYEERGLLKEGSVEPTAYYSAGRIDIRGLDSEKYWSGCSEYSSPAMHGEDWNAFSEWLVGLETTELLEFDDIIAQYEQQSERKIRWYKDDHLEEQEGE